MRWIPLRQLAHHLAGMRITSSKFRPRWSASGQNPRKHSHAGLRFSFDHSKHRRSEPSVGPIVDFESVSGSAYRHAIISHQARVDLSENRTSSRPGCVLSRIMACRYTAVGDIVNRYRMYSPPNATMATDRLCMQERTNVTDTPRCLINYEVSKRASRKWHVQFGDASYTFRPVFDKHFSADSNSLSCFSPQRKLPCYSRLSCFHARVVSNATCNDIYYRRGACKKQHNQMQSSAM